MHGDHFSLKKNVTKKVRNISIHTVRKVTSNNSQNSHNRYSKCTVNVKLMKYNGSINTFKLMYRELHRTVLCIYLLSSYYSSLSHPLACFSASLGLFFHHESLRLCFYQSFHHLTPRHCVYSLTGSAWCTVTKLSVFYPGWRRIQNSTLS